MDRELFDIVVCQIDWRITCSGQKPGQKKKSDCRTKKSVMPVARCGFETPLWNAGGTCIANHVHADKHPQCSKTTPSSSVALIKQGCRKATKKDQNACMKYATALAEYY
jgi:hypothetical protein